VAAKLQFGSPGGRGSSVEIWDTHCHISGIPGRTPDERMARLMEYADRMGVTRLCVHMGMKLVFDPSPEDFRGV
jgi:hypothetical protein